MKSKCLLLLLLMLSAYGFSQEISFEVSGKYQRSIPMETAHTARYMTDLMAGYPASWITDYVSVEVSGICDGKEMSSVGINDTLTNAQQHILSTADLGADIIIKIAYRKPNLVTLEMETRTLSYQATVIPDREAQYVGGSKEMNQYLKDNAIHKVEETASAVLKQGIIIFTINETGEIADARMAMSSGDDAIDQVLLAAIMGMPKWTPATNTDGLHVKQVFQFKVGTAINGC